MKRLIRMLFKDIDWWTVDNVNKRLGYNGCCFTGGVKGDK